MGVYYIYYIRVSIYNNYAKKLHCYMIDRTNMGIKKWSSVEQKKNDQVQAYG